MSQDFAQLHVVAFEQLLTPLMVHSPGSSWCTTMVSHGNIIDIGYNLFPTSFIALKSNDIDVILGMDWLSKSQAIIDCVARSIIMTSPVGRTFIYWSPFINTTLCGVYLRSKFLCH
jgi:hypothetical protein